MHNLDFYQLLHNVWNLILFSSHKNGESVHRCHLSVGSTVTFGFMLVIWGIFSRNELGSENGEVETPLSYVCLFDQSL